MSDCVATSRTVALQAPPSMGFSRQEYWSGLPFPPPGIFLTQGSNLDLYVCCLGRQTLYPRATGSPVLHRVVHICQCSSLSSVQFPSPGDAEWTCGHLISSPAHLLPSHKSILHLHSCGHSFLTLTQKRKQPPPLSQGISATPTLSVKGDRSAGSQVPAV